MYGAQEKTRICIRIRHIRSIWNQAYAYPRLRSATFADFFKYIDEHFWRSCRPIRATWTVFRKVNALPTPLAAQDRQNQSDVLTSEIVSTVAHIVNPAVRRPEAEFDDAWNNILLLCQTRQMFSNSISQPSSEEAVKQLAVKDDFATQAHFELDDIAETVPLYPVASGPNLGGTLVLFDGFAVKRDALAQRTCTRIRKFVRI